MVAKPSSMEHRTPLGPPLGAPAGSEGSADGTQPGDERRWDVPEAAGADQGTEVQIEIRAELQPPIRMGNSHRSFDVIGDRFRRGIGPSHQAGMEQGAKGKVVLTM